VRVTHLMSSLVGALLFARAIDDPVQSEAILHSMRRCLRAEFGEAPAGSGAIETKAADAGNDFLRVATERRDR
jgi:hypothetical protein